MNQKSFSPLFNEGRLRPPLKHFLALLNALSLPQRKTLHRWWMLLAATLMAAMGVTTAQAQGFSAADYPAGVNYTATARVDESIGLRAGANIGTAVGITPMDTRLTRPNATMVASHNPTLPVTVTPYPRYTLDRVVVAAIATITHTNGTKSAVKDIFTSGMTAFTYSVPDFRSYVTSGDFIDVEIVVYADLTYALTAADCITTIDLAGNTAATIILGANTGITLTANSQTILIDAALVTGPIRVTGTAVRARHIVVHNTVRTDGTNRRVDVLLDDARILLGADATADNYTVLSNTGGAGTIGYGNVRHTGALNGAANTFTRWTNNTIPGGNTSYTTRSAFHIIDADVYMTLAGTTPNTHGHHNVLANTGNANAHTSLGQAIFVDASASLVVTDASTRNLYARGGTCGAAIGSQSYIPSGYMQFDGGDVTAIAASNNHHYAGIGNGGHYGDSSRPANDPGIRGYVQNGGIVRAMGFHYGIGGNGGGGVTPLSVSHATGPAYLIVTGGSTITESATSAGGAAFGFAHNNAEHTIRIGRPDKDDSPYNSVVNTGLSMLAVNWGYGAAISGNMTFYSGEIEAYSGEYAAAIGGNAVSRAGTENATAAQAQGSPASSVAGTPLTVYGGHVTAVAGAFTQGAPHPGNSGANMSSIRGGTVAAPRNTAESARNLPRPAASYGAAIGGAVRMSGGTANNIFAGTFNVTSSTHGAGIGGGGGYTGGTQNQPGGSGGNTWIGNLYDRATGAVAPMDFNVTSSTYGAGIGGGGSSTGAGGNGGDIYISGGTFDIQSGAYGSGIGGGGSLSGNAGSGGNVVIDAETDANLIAQWVGGGGGGGIIPATYSFNIMSGQFGAGIGGGGSRTGNAGIGATTLSISGGNFGITAGGVLSAYPVAGTPSFGAGIGGGGSFNGNGGKGPDNATISGGYFDVSSTGFGAAIGGGGSSTGVAGGGGNAEYSGGTVVVQVPGGLGSVGMGGGHSTVAANSRTTVGDVTIIGGNIATTIDSVPAGADPTQRARTLPDPSTTTTPMAIRVEVPREEIGKKVDTVLFTYGGNSYTNYGVDSLYITEAINDAGDQVGFAWIWVPSEHALTYDLTSGNVAGGSDFDIDHAARMVPGATTLTMSGTAFVYYTNNHVPLLEWNQLIRSDLSYYGTTWGSIAPAATYHAGAGNRLNALTEHAAVGGDPVYLIGWSATNVNHIFGKDDGEDFTDYFITEAQFTDADITVYALWGYDTDGNGIPDVRKNVFSLLYDANDSVASPALGVPVDNTGYAVFTTANIALDIPTRAGYVFIGWTATPMNALTRNDTVPTGLYIGGTGARAFGAHTVNGDTTITFTASSITRYALWAEDVNNNGIPDLFDPTYAVLYHANGGSGTLTDPNSLYLTDITVTVLGQGSITRSNHSFTGWNTMPDGSGLAYTVGDTFVITGDTTLYAQWVAVFSLNYNGNDNAAAPAVGTPVDNTEYAALAAATIAGAIPTRTGYVFIGWTATRINALTRTGTIPAGLYIGGAGTRIFGANTVTGDTTITFATTDITLYALWAEDVNNNGIPDLFDPTYAVLYDANGGNGTLTDPNSRYLTGLTVTVLGQGAITRDNHGFTGWNTVPDGSGGVAYAAGDTFVITSDITLYAQWSAVFSLNYNGNDNAAAPAVGSPVDNTEYAALASATIADAIPTRTGYIFVGWSATPLNALTRTDTIPAGLYIGGAGTRVFGGNIVTGGTTITFATTNITLYALWAEDVNNNGIPDLFDPTYAVLYDANGGNGTLTDPNSSYLTDLTVTVLGRAAITRSNHSFTGWNTMPDGSGVAYAAGDTFVITGDTTLYAQWSVTPLSTTEAIPALNPAALVLLAVVLAGMATRRRRIS